MIVEMKCTDEKKFILLFFCDRKKAEDDELNWRYCQYVSACDSQKRPVRVDEEPDRNSVMEFYNGVIYL